MHVCLFEPPNFLHALHQFLYFDLFPHKKNNGYYTSTCFIQTFLWFIQLKRLRVTCNSFHYFDKYNCLDMISCHFFIISYSLEIALNASRQFRKIG